MNCWTKVLGERTLIPNTVAVCAYTFMYMCDGGKVYNNNIIVIKVMSTEEKGRHNTETYLKHL